ncbi:MAG: valine--tRNA ligase, partial [Lentisphaerae bacterium]|nr:valine--tRNA ligase [Lentisphaerota bacterium]
MLALDKTYDAQKVEDVWYSRWLEKQCFHAEASRGGTPYTIVIPPPNVTGILHMGHALNATIQDILIRWRRMQGRNTLWLPGTDHAGIATQNVVETALRKEDKTRSDLGREQFVKRVWEWRAQYGATIIQQLKKLGAACDWQRERFTMDEGLSAAVAEVFVRLYNKKLIYRGNYIINWCPRCRTALSDEESVHVETPGKLYYLRYPLKKGQKKDAVIVATTRPETLLGDVAVAVNPRDERYAHLKDKQFVLPILDRPLKVVQDDFVDPKFGTGAVKVTPAHDPNDFEIGQRHGLTPINVMNPDGTMNENAGPYRGLDRFACRERIVEDLKKQGLVEKIEPHTHAVAHCYRCNTAIEPRLSLQWFVRMKPLARPAIEAVKDGRIQFVPERWTKVYLDWMENIRDWCISRQIWWGHRLPVFYCQAGHEWAAKGQPEACPQCGSKNFQQDEDVLDTWFSSWLWPFSTLGFPTANKDLAFYYPTHTLVTGSEIIFFWVARMIMAGLEFMGAIPFRTVYIHGTVRDDIGRKMSKSLGNSIDPLAIIKDFSADALRFSLIMVTAVGQDVYLAREHFEVGRNFLTKIWNAARFMQLQTQDAPGRLAEMTFQSELLTPDDKHILARLHETIAQCAENLERCRFNDLAKTLYEFVWRQFCDWYIESAKIALNGADQARRAQTLLVMHYVFGNALMLLHPIIPFITEELWHALGYGAEDDFIINAPWPKAIALEELGKWGINDRI